MSDEVKLLRLSGVMKRYDLPGADGEGPVVLREIDLEVSAGESLAIVGPSGSGKSTLLNIMGSLDTPTSGTVLLEGRDLAALRRKELAALRNRDVGFVFQLHHLLPQCTVLENVLVPTLAGFGSPGDPVARATRLLQRVGLAHRLDYRPGQISGGEAQRAAVVRALVNQPKLLLADEPTGSLDRKASENLSQLLVELNREEGVTLVVVTHSADVAAKMSRRLTLTDGVLAGEEQAP